VIRQTRATGYSQMPSVEGLDWSRVHVAKIARPKTVQ
jgi:hypothetical protein